MEQDLWTSFWCHVDALRATLLRIVMIVAAGFVLLLCFYQPLFHLLISSASPEPLLILGPLDGIALVCKVCFWLSLALTAPLWGWIIMLFVMPGLNQREKKVIIPFLIGSCFCISLGGVIAYYITIPLSNEYLNAFNASIGQNAWALTHYIDYTLILFLGHAVAFELGLILLTLVHVGWLGAEWLVEKRRYMIVAAFIIGALLTPPDVASQLLLAVPLMILYELAIFYAKWRRLLHSDVN